MDRLTEKHYAEKGYYMKCSEKCEKFNCDTCESIADIVDRLGEYEDAEARGELVRVVRCKDCVHYEMGACLKIYDDGTAAKEAWQERKPDDFCSKAALEEG